MSVGPETSPSADRCGVLAGGNFIVDTVIRIDAFPREEMLANILDETPSNGGGPYNVLRNLAALGSPFPLAAVGMVGNDGNGRWIREDCEKHGINTAGLQTDASAPTSHTHVMTALNSGRRTFFHHRGANARLGPQHFDFTQTRARLFYLGYLLLLDQLDQSDSAGVTGAARVLAAARQAGLTTVVDLVSVADPRFRDVVTSSIRSIDHLLINEVEASRLLGSDLASDDAPALARATRQVLELGVTSTVIIHTPHGATAASHEEGELAVGSLTMDETLFKGANGAGDGFAAGYLYGLHEGWALERRLQLAVCTAAASLTHSSPSEGVKPCLECLDLAHQFGHRPWSTDERPETTS